MNDTWSRLVGSRAVSRQLAGWCEGTVSDRAFVPAGVWGVGREAGDAVMGAAATGGARPHTARVALPRARLAAVATRMLARMFARPRDRRRGSAFLHFHFCDRETHYFTLYICVGW